MEEKRRASQGIGDQKAAIRTKSSLGLNCQLHQAYIQVRTSMTNSPINRLVRRLVSPSVSELVSISDQSLYSKAISQPMSHPSHSTVGLTDVSVSLWVISPSHEWSYMSRVTGSRVGPENTSNLISLRPRDGAYHICTYFISRDMSTFHFSGSNPNLSNVCLCFANKHK